MTSECFVVSNNLYVGIFVNFEAVREFIDTELTYGPHRSFENYYIYKASHYITYTLYKVSKNTHNVFVREILQKNEKIRNKIFMSSLIRKCFQRELWVFEDDTQK